MKGISKNSMPENALLARFESFALNHRQHTAIVDGHRRLDYEHLHIITSEIARTLLENDRTADGVVAVLVQNEMDMCVGLLSTQKAGKTFIPLNLNFPETRLSSILNTLERGSILVDEATVDLASRISNENFHLIRIDNLAQTNPRAYSTPTYDPQALSWIIFTSGSTGQPKGVMQTYRNANQFTRQAIRSLQPEPTDRLAIASSLTSHAGVVFTLSTLSSGAALCLMEPSKRPITALASWLSDEKVTILAIVPTLFRRLAEKRSLHDGFATLRQLRLTGETVTSRDVTLFNRTCPADCTLAVGYGATEIGGISEAFFTQASAFADGRIPVGFAHNEVEIHLVDERNELVSINEPGEIVVISNYLSPGYWNQPDLTRSVFSDMPDGRIRYRTGDIGILGKDGALEHLGRKDSQVKISGHRVEIAEIETALLAIPAVKEAAVQSFTGADKQLRLTAYVAVEERMSALQIRSDLAQTLPTYMIPSNIIQLDQLPLTGNGKVDRHALQERGKKGQHYPFVDNIVAPRTETEEKLVTIWRDALGVDHISIHNNFFELGGDSLLGVQVVALAQQAGLNIALQDLYTAQTIDDLAAIIDDAGPKSSADPLLFPMNSHGSRPPFFYAHGIFGDVSSILNVAPLLDRDLPLYGLLAAGLLPDQEPDQTIEQMAARYIKVIQRVQPAGPYYIGGFCFGGVIAYEIARQLEQLGEKTALLVIIEGSTPRQFHTSAPFYNRQRLQIIRDNFPFVSKGYQQMGGSLAKEKLRLRLGRGKRRQPSRSIQDDQNWEYDIEADFNTLRPEIQHQLREINRLAGAAYRPGPYGGKVTLFRARFMRISHALFGKIDPTRGWAAVAKKGVDIRYIDGYHTGILKLPYATGLAAALTHALREAS